MDLLCKTLSEYSPNPVKCGSNTPVPCFIELWRNQPNGNGNGGQYQKHPDVQLLSPGKRSRHPDPDPDPVNCACGGTLFKFWMAEITWDLALWHIAPYGFEHSFAICPFIEDLQFIYCSLLDIVQTLAQACCIRLRVGRWVYGWDKLIVARSFNANEGWSLGRLMLSSTFSVCLSGIKSQENTGNSASQLVIQSYPIDLLH